MCFTWICYLNWLQEHIGIFDFQEDALGTTTVSVTSPDSDAPFFSVKILPTTDPIPVEVNLTLTGGYLNFVQPPLPSGTLPVEVGTTTWKGFLLNGESFWLVIRSCLILCTKGQTATVQAAAISGALPAGKIGDGIEYPDVQPLLPIGVRLSGLLDFPVAEVFDSF